MGDRVDAIAWHRISRLIDLHQADATTREIKARQATARRNGAGGPRPMRSRA